MMSKPSQNYHFICLAILWWASVVVYSPAIGSATTIYQRSTPPNNGPPNVSVRMSTSIVESANYQPAPEQHQVHEQAELTSAQIPQHQESDVYANHLHAASPQQRGPRFGGPTDSFAARSDNHQQLLSHIPPNSPYQPALLNSNGRVLDQTAGYRWSVSTSRNLSPAAIQVLQQHLATTNKTQLTAPYKISHDKRQESRGLIRRVLDGGQQTLMDLRCEGRGIGKMLKSILMLGSSFLAATIPLAVVYSNLVRSSSNSPPNRRMSAAAAGDDGPLSFVRYLSIQSRVDSMMGWIERSVEHLPNFPRLHPQECVKRSICEVHNEPEKYGAIGFILRLLFPATNLNSTDRMDNMEYKVINKYRHAAGYGLNKRIESNGTNVSACRDKYEDCLISLLDVARNMMDAFLR